MEHAGGQHLYTGYDSTLKYVLDHSLLFYSKYYMKSFLGTVFAKQFWWKRLSQSFWKYEFGQKEKWGQKWVDKYVPVGD